MILVEARAALVQIARAGIALVIFGSCGGGAGAGVAIGGMKARNTSISAR
jgi:hypothetical protein